MMGDRTGDKPELIDAEPGEGDGGPIVRPRADASQRASRPSG